MKFNINDMVRVKLTDVGRKALEDEHKKFWSSSSRPEEPYTPPKEDADGWSEWQLWRLMNRLGSYVQMGTEVPFETTIEIVKKEEV